jgi:alpha-aminoadipate carrier protein LysW
MGEKDLLSEDVIDVSCPECEYAFRIEDPQVGEVIVCGDCSLNLKVKEVDKAARTAVLELTKTRGEDWGE